MNLLIDLWQQNRIESAEREANSAANSARQSKEVAVDLQSRMNALALANQALFELVAERFGIKHSTFHPASLEIPAGFVQSVGDAVILSAKLDDLRTLQSSNGEAKDVHEAQPVDVTRT